MPQSISELERKERTPEQQAKATHTGWIREMERAMRASQMHPTAKLIYSAMIDHTNSLKRACWAAQSSIAIATHLSVPTVRKYSAQLEAANMIERQGKSNRGSIRFGFPEAWKNGVLDLQTIKRDEHRKNETERKARNRAKKREDVTQSCLRQKTEVSRKDRLEVSRNHGCDELHKLTPNRTSNEERDNPYAHKKAKSIEPKAE